MRLHRLPAGTRALPYTCGLDVFPVDPMVFQPLGKLSDGLTLGHVDWVLGSADGSGDSDKVPCPASLAGRTQSSGAHAGVSPGSLGLWPRVCLPPPRPDPPALTRGFVTWTGEDRGRRAVVGGTGPSRGRALRAPRRTPHQPQTRAEAQAAVCTTEPWSFRPCLKLNVLFYTSPYTAH